MIILTSLNAFFTVHREIPKRRPIERHAIIRKTENDVLRFALRQYRFINVNETERRFGRRRCRGFVSCFILRSDPLLKDQWASVIRLNALHRIPTRRIRFVQHDIRAIVIWQRQRAALLGVCIFGRIGFPFIMHAANRRPGGSRNINFIACLSIGIRKR